MVSVTTPSTRLIFCEGQSDSLDVAVLQRFLPFGNIQIIPVGGKSAMRAYVNGYINSYGDPRPSYLGFRDRDFDVEPPDTPQLIPLIGTTPIWMTYRACIESYLIDKNLLHKYWSDSSAGPAWKHGEPLSVSEIKGKILEAARQLAEYQAVRWALAKLKPGARWPEIETRWTKASGSLPNSLAFTDCMAQAQTLLDDFQEQVQGVTETKLHELADIYRSRFVENSFYEQELFLIWFHGKDLLALVCQLLGKKFPRAHYEKWAAAQFDLKSHRDFEELATKLK